MAKKKNTKRISTEERKKVIKLRWTQGIIATILVVIIILIVVFTVNDGPNPNKYSGERVFNPSGKELAISKCMEKHTAEWKADPNTEIKKDHIFVSIPAYRDDECRTTIAQMYKQAKHPDRIHCGVVQQIKVQKENCFYQCEECKYRLEMEQIRIIEYDFTEARGPCQARYQASTLWRGEEWYMQIDSHTKFEPDWDETALTQLEKSEDKKAVLGGYPPTESQMDGIRRNRGSMTMMCDGNRFNKDGIPMILASVVNAGGREKPVLQPFVGANLMIMPYTALLDVPFDPYLSFLFFGEEILYSARLWTAGYNFYAPTIPFCSHHYARPGKPKFWDDNSSFSGCKAKAVTRCKYLLNLKTNIYSVHNDFRQGIEKYGMGKQRTLKQYWEFAGVDPVAKRVHRNCKIDAYEKRMKEQSIEM